MAQRLHFIAVAVLRQRFAFQTRNVIVGVGFVLRTGIDLLVEKIPRRRHQQGRCACIALRVIVRLRGGGILFAHFVQQRCRLGMPAIGQAGRIVNARRRQAVSEEGFSCLVGRAVGGGKAGFAGLPFALADHLPGNLFLNGGIPFAARVGSKDQRAGIGADRAVVVIVLRAGI